MMAAGVVLPWLRESVPDRCRWKSRRCAKRVRSSLTDHNSGGPTQVYYEHIVATDCGLITTECGFHAGVALPTAVGDL